MIKIKDGKIDFTYIRRYHSEIEFIANSLESAGNDITNVEQPFYLDIPGNKLTSFYRDYEQLFNNNGIYEEHALPLLFLIQKTYSDIENLKLIDNELLEVKHHLSFLYDALCLKENSIRQQKAKLSEADEEQFLIPQLTLRILPKNGKNAAALESPAIANLVLNNIIDAFKNPAYNTQLSSYLGGVEVNSNAINNILKELNHRKTNIESYAVSETILRILAYLNNHTSLSFNGKIASNQQCRFVYDILSLFNLLKCVTVIKNIPRTKEKIVNYKVNLIKTLVKNINRYQ